MMIEIMAQLVHIRLDNGPGFLEEKTIKPIRARSLVIRKVQDNFTLVLKGTQRCSRSG